MIYQRLPGSLIFQSSIPHGFSGLPEKPPDMSHAAGDQFTLQPGMRSPSLVFRGDAIGISWEDHHH